MSFQNRILYLLLMNTEEDNLSQNRPSSNLYPSLLKNPKDDYICTAAHILHCRGQKKVVLCSGMARASIHHEYPGNNFIRIEQLNTLGIPDDNPRTIHTQIPDTPPLDSDSLESKRP